MTSIVKKLPGVQLLGIRSKTQITPRVLEAGKDLLAIGAFCIGACRSWNVFSITVILMSAR